MQKRGLRLAWLTFRRQHRTPRQRTAIQQYRAILAEEYVTHTPACTPANCDVRSILPGDLSYHDPPYRHGSENTALGMQALLANTTGHMNTAFGYSVRRTDDARQASNLLNSGEESWPPAEQTPEDRAAELMAEVRRLNPPSRTRS